MTQTANETLGFISIRNEDGTQWKADGNSWGDRCFRRPHLLSAFEELESKVEESKKNDCPDNGFFGLWNLTWHPCTVEEAEEANRIAYAAEMEDEAEYARLEAQSCRAPNQHG